VNASLAAGFSRAGIVGPELRPGLTCLIEGRLDDMAEDALAAAYTSRGVGMLDGLSGSFALLVWDESARRGLVAVDPLGSRSIFFHDGGDGCLRFATEVGELLNLLSATPGPSEPAVARWLAYGALDSGETLYEGIRRLPGGHAIVLDDGAWREYRYWRPTYRGAGEATAETAAGAVRQGLSRAVERRCRGKATGILLSGGLDSSSVAALASDAGAASLRAYSAVFPDAPEADESELVGLLAASAGLPSHTEPVAANGVLASAVEHVRQWRLPSASPIAFFQRGLLAQARADGVAVVLDGQGGDELFDASPYLLGDLTRALRLPAALRSARALAGGDSRLVRRNLARYALGGAAPAWAHTRRSKLRRRTAPHWLSTRAAALAGDRPGRHAWLELDGPRWWSWLADALTVGRERTGAHDHLRRKLAAEGLAGGHPLLDDLELIELVLGLPPELAYEGSLDRPLLRRAVSGLVPDEIRLRSSKSYFNGLVTGSLDGPEKPFLVELLSSPQAEVRAFVTDARMRDVVEGPKPYEHPHHWSANAWRLASTELWLRSLRTG
jgi:asparagine synthase (glutamine-hydrolysing)